MDTNWSLESLYKGIDTDDFKKDFDDFKTKIKTLNDFCKDNFINTNNACEKIENFIVLIEDISNYYKIGNYLSLRTATNSRDFSAMKLLDKFENTATDLASSHALFTDFVKEIDNLPEIINSSPFLEEYRFFLMETKTFSNYSLSEKEEILLQKMKTTGSSSFEKLRDNTVSSITVEMLIDGETKKVPFSELRNLAYDDSEEVRKKAYLAEMEAYKKVEDTVSTALNAIKGEALTETSLRGYTSILDRTLINSRMSKKTFDALIESIKDTLPELRKYYFHKAKLLGHKNGLPFYDLFANIGKVSLKFSYDEAKNTIIDNFSLFHKDLGDFAKYAFDNNWVDPFPKEGKRDGAFCSNIHQIKESRVLSNFTGSFSDMTTLAHELGHAFHGDCLKDEKYLNSDYPMPIAETASIFCETIIEHEFMKKATADEKIVLLNNSITDALQVLVDIYSRFVFEDSLINERENGTLSSEEVSELMKNAQIEAYGDSLDKDFLHQYMWLAKPHYYSSDYNYYNFPYAFGMLFAKGVYAEYLSSTDKEVFFEKYKELLMSTGKMSLEDIGKKMDFDIENKDFWKTSINLVINDIEEFINLTNF